MSYRDVPPNLRSGYVWRWLRGGVWLYSFYGWTRIRVDETTRIRAALWLRKRKFHVEDHRWFRKKGKK